MSWSTQKTVLGWDLNTVAQFICLPPKHHSKVHAFLEATPQATHNTLLRKRRKLLGMLCSITPAVYRGQGVFIFVQHALTKASCRHVHLTSDVHDELNA